VWLGFLVGYSPRNKAYRVWNPSKRRVEVARNVRFVEEQIVRSNRSEEVMVPSGLPAIEEKEDDDPGESEIVEKPLPIEKKIKKVSYENNEKEENKEVERDENDENDENDEIRESEVEEVQPPQPLRRSTRVSKPPKIFTTDKVGNLKLMNREVHLAYCYSAVLDEPQSLEEALSGPEKEKWEEGWKSEMKSQEENRTWEIVNMPRGRKLVDCKYIFKKKRDSEGNVSKYKVRLVARGFTQVHGVDYHDTFAPVLKFCSLRMLLAIAAKRDMEVHQMDVEVAFLNGELDEEIYMKPPDGLEVPAGKVLRLKKSLYGLKQAPLCWNKRIDDFLLNQGFRRLISDTAVYTKGLGKDQIIIGIFVDDLLILCESMSGIREVKQSLSREFKMKDLGEVGYILGMRIKRNRERGVLSIDQSQ
jgi:hypothetical protein